MCNPLCQRSRKDFILMGIANLALAFGVGLPYFIHPARGTQLDLVDALRGLLMGFSICINFSLIRKARSAVAIPKR
jgi:hypothetical protein